MTPSAPRASQLMLMALVVGAFFTAEEMFMNLARQRGSTVGQDVVDGLAFWLVWALLAPAIAVAVRRWPLDSAHLTRPLMSHAAVAVTLAVLHNLITAALGATLASAGVGGSVGRAFDPRIISPAFVWGVFTGLVFYAVVVGLSAASAFRAELAQVKLDTLRSQLRPHFLFNSLNAISVFVGEDAAVARLMILRLSTLLRRSLDQRAHEVSLREELEIANDYLDIQRGRFGDRLAVVIDVSPEAMRGNIPVFLLQPLLENAIEHGMPDDRPITVTVRASRAAGSLRVAVIDDGVGLADERTQRSGIGIANTRARLEQLYGGNACVDWRSRGDPCEAPGTSVEVELPYRESRI